MNDDLVAELRKYTLRVCDGSAVFCKAPIDLLEEAVFEIERLRNAIKEIRAIAVAQRRARKCPFTTASARSSLPRA